MTRISFDEMKDTIKQAFIKAGMSDAKAEICARVHTESSQDGVASHGLNRVERFVEYLGKEWVLPEAEPTCTLSLGMMEVYNGNLGPGITNAMFCMNRATEMAKTMGMGLVSLQNTTHWMRGGSYGWLAAEKGCIGICWTNTESCMPAWGATSIGVGNNPLIIAVPRKEGHMVLDMAMSLYSYGKLQVTRLKNQKLPYPGGYNQQGELTDDPLSIEETRRFLPMGYWKGSGLAVMLDVLAGLLSGGNTTAGVDLSGKGNCGSCSQVFIAIDPLRINTQAFIDQALEQTIQQIKSSARVTADTELLYPGEQSLQKRNENIALGIPVDDTVWTKVKELAGFL